MSTATLILCHYCHHTPFPDYTALAQHIIAEKRTHRKGRIWAAKFLTRQRQLDQSATIKARRENRAPLTEQEKENRQSTLLELSGETTVIITSCPQCKSKMRQAIPVEYAKSKDAWRTTQGILVVSCARCQK